MATNNNTSPPDFRIFQVPAPNQNEELDPAKPPKMVNVCLGMELSILPGWGQYYLVHAANPEGDQPPDDEDEEFKALRVLRSPFYLYGGVHLRLSNFMPDHPLGYPDKDGHRFWMKTYSENVGLLEAMVQQGILEAVPGKEVKKEFVTYPLIKVKLRDLRAIAKRCGWCQKWEIPSQVKANGGQRFRACSRCKRTWYCSTECQTRSWKEPMNTLVVQYPPHKEQCPTQPSSMVNTFPFVPKSYTRP